MNIFLIEAEDAIGLKTVLTTIFNNRDEALEALEELKKNDSYKHLVLKTLNASKSDILFELIKLIGYYKFSSFTQIAIKEIK
jgi:endonuclease III-like uncharacterized protein